MQTPFHDAIMLLCPLLAFVVAPPRLLRGVILMVMAGMTVVPSIDILISLGKPDWKQWNAGDRTGTAESTLKH